MSCATFFDGAHAQLDTEHLLDEVLGDTLGNETGGTGKLALLVDGQHTVDTSSALVVAKLGNTRPGQSQSMISGEEVQGLEVLGLTGGRRDRDLLGTEQGVNCAGLTHVGVSD